MSDERTCVGDAQMMQPQFFLGANLKVSEAKTGRMRLHANLSCSLVAPTLTQIDSIYSVGCWQMAAAPLGGDLLWFSFGETGFIPLR